MQLRYSALRDTEQSRNLDERHVLQIMQSDHLPFLFGKFPDRLPQPAAHPVHVNLTLDGLHLVYEIGFANNIEEVSDGQSRNQ